MEPGEKGQPFIYKIRRTRRSCMKHYENQQRNPFRFGRCSVLRSEINNPVKTGNHLLHWLIGYTPEVPQFSNSSSSSIPVRLQGYMAQMADFPGSCSDTSLDQTTLWKQEGGNPFSSSRSSPWPQNSQFAVQYSPDQFWPVPCKRSEFFLWCLLRLGVHLFQVQFNGPRRKKQKSENS